MSISSEVAEHKQRLRDRMKSLLLSEMARRPRFACDDLAKIIEQRVLSNRLVPSDLLCYAAFKSEFPTQEFFERWKKKYRLYFPRCENGSLRFHRIQEWNDLTSGPLAPEPSATAEPWQPSSDNATILVPGMAFAPNGIRLGRGKGYYDRFLATQPRLRRLGLAFSFQVLEGLPSDPHDQPIDEILTPQGLWICPRRVL